MDESDSFERGERLLSAYVEKLPTMAGRDLPKRVNQKSAIKLLKENGWTRAKGGKHVVKMTKPGCRPVTLPTHRGQDYSPGLTRSIMKQAGLL